MKNKVQYIVVHSTQTLPSEFHFTFPFHYLINRNGKVNKNRKVTKADRAVHVAYVGGIDKGRKVCDTRTEHQNEVLFRLVVLLSEKYPKARIFGADEILGPSNEPGFKVRDWLKTYIPQFIRSAA
jgi:hypothetical protein